MIFWCCIKLLFPLFFTNQLKTDMANTYTQLYIQYVFAVQHRESLINEDFREDLQKYITGIARNNKHKMLAIYCMPDHAHIFLGLNPNQSISKLANDLKTNSSKWINDNKKCKSKFNWQTGYGAFSYHNKMIPIIGDYIANQPSHHRKETFKDEYLKLLHEFDIDFKDEYLFNFF